MSPALQSLFASAEDRAPAPLFVRRRMFQCAWPLWQGGEPLEEKRCCGQPVRGAGQPYCPSHRLASSGRGTPSERRAIEWAAGRNEKGKLDARA